jgi:hypothetical protein
LGVASFFRRRTIFAVDIADGNPDHLCGQLRVDAADALLRFVIAKDPA